MTNQKFNDSFKKPKFNWKYILIVVILTFLIGGGILGYQWWSSKKEAKLSELPGLEEEKLETLINKCKNIEPEKEQSISRTLCFINLGKERKDIELCDKIKDVRRKAYCYGGIAGADKNLKICANLTEKIEKLGKEELQEELGELPYFPEEICYAGAAVAQNETNVCAWYSHVWLPASVACHCLMAILKNDLGICDGLQEVSGKGVCYACFGDFFQDSDICGKLQEQGNKDFCLQTLAPWFKNASLCEEIKNYESKDWCYISIAGALSNINICEDQIQKDSNRYYCYQSATKHGKDVSICKTVPEIHRDNCYENIAKNLKDINICKNISAGRSRCYMDISEELDDENVCDKIQDPSDKKSCYYGVLKARNDIGFCEEYQGIEKLLCYETLLEDLILDHVKDLNMYTNICEKMMTEYSPLLIDEPYLYKDSCYLYVVQKLAEEGILVETLKDESICENIKNQEVRGNCYLNIASITHKNICEKIQGLKDKNACFSSLAIELKDKNLCEKITDQKMKDLCMIRVRGGTTMCERLSEFYTAPWVIDSCYLDIAKEQRNKEICNQIQDANTKNKCDSELDLIIGLTNKGWRLPEK